MLKNHQSASPSSSGNDQQKSIVMEPAGEPTKMVNKIEQLLKVEGSALEAKNRRALRHIAVNLTRTIVPYGHGIFFTKNALSSGKEQGWNVKSISSHGVVDRTSPFVKWLEGRINRNNQKRKINSDNSQDEKIILTQIDLNNIDNDGHFIGEVSYPFTNGVWIQPNKSCAMLFTRNEEWNENDLRILERLCKLYGCVWNSIGYCVKQKKLSPLRHRIWQFGIAGLCILAIWPVSMTTLAPAEIIAANPQIISSPLNGVVEKIHVPPNSFVKKGALIATYIDTQLRNEHALAIEEAAVAKARLDRTRLASFSDGETLREIKIMETEHTLAEKRRDYAFDNLKKTTLYAQSDGLLIYNDRDEWAGRPVSVGERIATIAKPENVELKIEAPVGDGNLLKTNAKVRLFLDSDPLKSVRARLDYTSYYPEPTPGGNLAYLATASLAGNNLKDHEKPRIGARGVAKIYGEKAPLGLWVLRRPIVSIRQYVGL